MENNLTIDYLPTAVNDLSKKFDTLLRLLEHNNQNKETFPEQLLTVEQASQFLSLSVPTIYSKVSRGELPVCKPAGSKRVYFSKEDLLKYIKKGRQQTNAEIEEHATDHLIRKNKAIR